MILMVSGATYICALPEGRLADAKLPATTPQCQFTELNPRDKEGGKGMNQYMSLARFSSYMTSSLV